MKKAVLLSIQPKWCELIASGKKTLEVRKTRPKLKTPFRVYIYRTKSKDRLVEIVKDGDLNYGEIYHGKPVFIKANSRYHDYVGDGKVIGEFTCDDICIFQNPAERSMFPWDYDHACLKQKDIEDYAEGKTIYGWHISDFWLYDKPRELNSFSATCPEYGKPDITDKCRKCKHLYTNENDMCVECDVEGELALTKPPQSWYYIK